MSAEPENHSYPFAIMYHTDDGDIGIDFDSNELDVYGAINAIARLVSTISKSSTLSSKHILEYLVDKIWEYMKSNNDDNGKRTFFLYYPQ